MRICLTAALLVMVTPALAAPALEQWNCRLSSGSQHWGIEGDLLVTDMLGLPPAMTRLPVVKNTGDVVMAVSDEYAGRRFEIVLIDKLKMTIRIVTLGAESGALGADTGTCVSGFARGPVPYYVPPVAGARLAPARSRPSAPSPRGTTVRPLIQSLLQQAQNLTAQGFYDAALRKIRETGESPRHTPEEDALIAQTRAYVMQKSGGKAR
jgi:hypothetical protein